MGKLVRDRIPDIIRAGGRVPGVRVLNEADYLASLFDKLCEEAQELRCTDPDKRLEEAADVYEVLLSIAAATGTTMERIQAAAKRKRDQRGGFAGRIWLESQ